MPPIHSIRGRMVAEWAFVAIGLALFAWTVFDGVWFRLVSFGTRSDIWEHVTVLRTWSQDILDPVHPHTGGPEGSPRFTPLSLLYSLVVRLTPLTPLQVFGLAGAVHTAVFLLGLRWFTRTWFNSPWAPVLALVVMLCVWGQGWGWSNAYSLRAYLLVAAYPSMGAFGLGLVLWGWTVSLLRRDGAPGVPEAVGLPVLSAVILITHPLTGVFILVGAVGLAALEPAIPRKRRVTLVALLGAGALLSLAWPYYSVSGVVFGRGMGALHDPVAALERRGLDRIWKIGGRGRGQYFYNVDQLRIRGGPALLGLPALVATAFLPRFRWLAVAAAAMAVPFLVNMVVPIPLGHRFLFFVFVFGHLALVALAVMLIEARMPPAAAWASRAVMVLLLAAALVSEVGLTARSFTSVRPDPFAGLDRPSPVVDRLRALATILPEGSMVLTDPQTGFGLPAFGGKVVSPLRGAAFLADRFERRMAVATFLEAGTDAATRRETLRRYAVTHVVVAKGDTPPDLLAFLRGTGTEMPGPAEDHVFAVER